MTFSEILFKTGKDKHPAICSSLTYGVTMGTTCPRSSKAPSTGAPKPNKILRALEKVLMVKAVSAVCDSDSVYCEVIGRTGTVGYYFDGTSILTTSPSTIGRDSTTVPLLLWACLPSVGCEETVKAIKQLVKEFAAGEVAPDTAGYLCDCFYYDTKAAFSGNVVTAELPSAKKAEIEQAIRTGRMEQFDLADIGEYINSAYEYIKADPRTPTTKRKTKTSKTKDEFMEACKNGDFEVGYDWSSEQLSRIRPISFLDNFVPNSAFRLAMKIANKDLCEVQDRLLAGKTGVEAIGNNYLNLIMVGKPGTGKTTTAEAMSAALGLPIYTVALSKNTEEDEMQGKTKVVKGGFEFKSTPFLDAYEHGGIIVLEEFNLADPGMMQGSLGQAIEYPFILLKDGYLEVRRHPLCIIISTMNAATQGARKPNEALTSRSPITIMMDDPQDEEFIGILKSKGYDSTECRRTHRAYKNILNYLRDAGGDEELTMAVTLRHCLGALKLIDIGLDFNEAIQNTMIGAIALDNLELAKEVYDSVIVSKRY